MKVGFFVPCYIDAIYPQAAKSTYELLEKLGMDVEFIEAAACRVVCVKFCKLA